MNDPHNFDLFNEKFGLQGASFVHLRPYVEHSPHAMFYAAVESEDPENIHGGILFFSFPEMGICLMTALAADEEVDKSILIDTIQFGDYKCVCAPFEFEGATEFVQGWWGIGDDLIGSAHVAIYFFYQFARGIKDPTADDSYMDIAIKLKELNAHEIHGESQS